MLNQLSTIPAWQLLVMIGVLLIVCEIFIPGFVLLPIGVGFLLTAIVAAFTGNWIIILACLAFFQVAIFWFFKDHLKRFHAKTRAYTNAEGMVGSECVVTEGIPKGGYGYVKLYGDTWMARSEHGTALKAGSRVIIVRVDGNKVSVEPVV